MSDTPSLKEMSAVIEEVLDSDGEVKIKASGNSMEPVIKNGKDIVVIRKLKRDIRKGDIILFKRDNNSLVLHRVTRLNGDDLTLRGDSQWTSELVNKSRVVGILDCIERDGRVISVEDKYFSRYKITLPLIRWKNRLINSIKIRLGAKNK